MASGRTDFFLVVSVSGKCFGPEIRFRRKYQVNCFLKFGDFFGGGSRTHTHQRSLSRCGMTLKGLISDFEYII